MKPISHQRRVIFLWALAWCGWAAVGQSKDLADARAKVYADYDARLQELALWCEQKQLMAEVKYTKAWQPERDPVKQYVFFPAAAFSPPWKNPAAASAAQHEWWDKFVALRKQQATVLFELAKQMLAEHLPREAFELAVETAREYPDHEQARIVLGHQKYQDAWYSPYGMLRTKNGDVWHDKYGWLPPNHVAKYDQGQRYVGGRFIKVEEEAKLREDIRAGWRIDTEHYAVLTNHSLEEGVKLTRRLERLYWIWQQVYFTYHTSEAELAKSFAMTAVPRKTRTQFKVMCFKDRTQYNAALQPVQPNINITLGAYFDSTRMAYFFAGEEQDPGTVDHEATHQLFSESRTVAKEAGKRNSFWIIEAVACYMESIVDHGDYVTLGGFKEGRVPAAQQRLLKDGFYLQLSDLTALGMEALQGDQRLPMLYSQSSGLALFLMHAQANKYREALAGYLDAVYSGRSEADTLAKLTGKSYSELDAEYRAFLQSEK